MKSKVEKYIDFIVAYGHITYEKAEVIGSLNGKEINEVSEGLVSYYLNQIEDYLTDDAKYVKGQDALDALSAKYRYYKSEPRVPDEVRKIIVDSVLMAHGIMENHLNSLDEEIIDSTGISLSGNFTVPMLAYLIKSSVELKVVKGSNSKLAKLMGSIFGNSGSRIKDKLSEKDLLKSKKDYDTYIHFLDDLKLKAQNDRKYAKD